MSRLLGAWSLATAVLAIAAVGMAPNAAADNRRLNSSVVANVYTIQHQAGCTNNVTVSPALLAAAQRHVDDLMSNRSLDADLGSDGSSPQDRANAAGFRGQVAETVAINPALSITGIEILNQWYSDPRPWRSCVTAPTP